MGSPERLKIEIMDTTLRDGEQTSGVSFMPHEKLLIARLLLQELNVDRIEVASARVSDGEKRAVSLICKWARSAGMLSRVEVLGFVDHTTSSTGFGRAADSASTCSAKARSSTAGTS